MKKRILVLMVGFLFVGINVFAADGDLIVNGNLTVQGTIQGIKLVHVTGTNPTCPSGTGGIIAKKYVQTTCGGGGGCPSCTISGWAPNGYTCQFNVVFYDEYGMGYCVPGGTCLPSDWTEAICMGN